MPCKSACGRTNTLGQQTGWCRRLTSFDAFTSCSWVGAFRAYCAECLQRGQKVFRLSDVAFRRCLQLVSSCKPFIVVVFSLSFWNAYLLCCCSSMPSLLLLLFKMCCFVRLRIRCTQFAYLSSIVDWPLSFTSLLPRVCCHFLRSIAQHFCDMLNFQWTVSGMGQFSLLANELAIPRTYLWRYVFMQLSRSAKDWRIYKRDAP